MNESEIIEMRKLNEEIISPEKFVKMTEEERQDISNSKIIVRNLGEGSLDNSDFAAVMVTWKTPHYKALF